MVSRNVGAEVPPVRRNTDAATLIVSGGKIVSGPRHEQIAQSVAMAGDRIIGTGTDAEMRTHADAGTVTVDARGRTVIPGLIDGHAHMDREGLKSRLPSLAGCASIAEILDRIAALAARAKPGEWIVTMPVGDPPAFMGVPECLAEGRFPTRADLDTVAPDNPVYIRSIWGYWRPTLPLVSIANTAALRAAGIDRDTKPPADSIEIERDAATGDPTGVFVEWNKMPVVEHTLMSVAPNFTFDARVDALAESMRLYNAVGTTGVFEGHGVAAQVIEAYKRLHRAGRQTVRATLMFSPAWTALSTDDLSGMVRSWTSWLSARGFGDSLLNIQGLYAEADDSIERELRASDAPQTGWAGFHFDSSLPRPMVEELLQEAARNGVQVSGIFPYILDLYRETHAKQPIDGLRWVFGHLSTITAEEIAAIADMGVIATTHTSAHIYKRGDEHLERLGQGRADEIVPLRALDAAGATISLGTDNVPYSLFHALWHTTVRTSRSGAAVGPDQAVSRLDALRFATLGGAALSFDEAERGSIEPGKLADMVILSDDYLTCDAAAIPSIVADTTIVNGAVVYDSGGAGGMAAT
jgi:predicted amidohydrolase YtcJ